jgi:hypothetical protein
VKARVFTLMLCSAFVTFAICGSTLAAAKRQALALVDIVPIPKLASLKGCPVSAWIHGQNLTSSYVVNFRKFPSGQAWKSGNTDATSGKLNVTIPWGFKVYAEVPSLGGIQSSPFACPAQNSHK